ncbi:hypothetical protein Poli38472_003661 [Pythium oligandrum]|uniref:Uncharacterized protein n=1 Tax=Pythium oligandrum TaxID=41045 RepID=A0A8K1FKC3_PYTOL|nr:hypothetical protein Poli38472_003661 [Pythium oligandrum]|eukprot:TMW65896.1 hypothetical protein Poli38472_003661 [Pythium oligandrum]
MRPVISAEYDRDGEQEIVLNPPPALRRETLQQHTQDPPQRGTSIAQKEIPSMGLDHSDDEFSSLDEEGSSLLQRPLEELERELGINFNDLSEEEKDDDSDDEELEDDRAQLLLRAKKLLAEQSLLSDDSDDEGHGYESQPL